MSRESYLLEQIRKLNHIGIALSGERDLDRLLDMIVREARSFYNCDGGSLYTVEGHELVFRVAQNETIDRRRREMSIPGEPFRSKRMPLSVTSLAGYVARSGRALIIDDVYRIPSNAGYQFDRTWDEANGYRTRSMLLAPLNDYRGESIGVLQLINSLDGTGEPIPFDGALQDLAQSLASQAAIAITNARLIARMRRATEDTIFRLSVAAEYKDMDTAVHLERMSRYSEVVARHLAKPKDFCDLIRAASPMHDIGKIGVPDAILLKPGRLSPEEFDEMKRHSEIGARILTGSDSELLIVSERIALTHHEKWDGSGYPRGLKGEDIPEEGRIVALADVFDALTSRRCYKPAFESSKAVEIMKSESKKHFDPNVLEAFLAGLGEILEIKEQLTK